MPIKTIVAILSLTTTLAAHAFTFADTEECRPKETLAGYRWELNPHLLSVRLDGLYQLGSESP
jgi:hypothetical protein